MTDYEALNRRLRAERPDPPAAGSPEWRKKRDTEAYANLAELERLATEFHRIWESKGFPGGEWIEVEGTQKLAWRCNGVYNGPDSYESSCMHVMIDGRLVHYLRSEFGNRVEGLRRRPPEITFMTLRQRIDQESVGLTNTVYETERLLRLMRYNLDLVRKK